MNDRRLSPTTWRRYTSLKVTENNKSRHKSQENQAETNRRRKSSKVSNLNSIIPKTGKTTVLTTGKKTILTTGKTTILTTGKATISETGKTTIPRFANPGRDEQEQESRETG